MSTTNPARQYFSVFQANRRDGSPVSLETLLDTHFLAAAAAAPGDLQPNQVFDRLWPSMQNNSSSQTHWSMEPGSGLRPITRTVRLPQGKAALRSLAENDVIVASGGDAWVVHDTPAGKSLKYLGYAGSAVGMMGLALGTRNTEESLSPAELRERTHSLYRGAANQVAYGSAPGRLAFVDETGRYRALSPDQAKALVQGQDSTQTGYVVEVWGRFATKDNLPSRVLGVVGTPAVPSHVALELARRHATAAASVRVSPSGVHAA